MNDNTASVREAVSRTVDEAALGRIYGWDGLSMFADKAVLEAVSIDSVEAAEEKWLARGHVLIGLVNCDDERFGEARLHLLASGHHEQSDIAVDCLEISPEIQ